MTRLIWDGTSEKYYETGTDRGVLYLEDTPGVPWVGLISVEQTDDGGTLEEYYLDGVKRLNHVMATDFKGKLTAYSAPRAFEVCEGVSMVSKGLYATQQPKSYFSLTYRTMIGNDVDGMNHAYKIHLIYNALASTPDRGFTTLSDKPKPISLSWNIEALPELATTYRPTAHFVIDSRRMSSTNLQLLEDKLYGTDTTDPELPTPAAIISLLV